MHKRTWIELTSVLAFGALVSVSACGGDDDDDSTGTGGDAGAATGTGGGAGAATGTGGGAGAATGTGGDAGAATGTGGSPSVGCSLPTGTFDGTDNADGTITDSVTGLMWWVTGIELQQTLATATQICEDSTRSGFDDWRLPTAEEARTLAVGCPGTLLGGTCQVCDGSCTVDRDTCLTGCGGCDWDAGPNDGDYSPPGFETTLFEMWTTTIAGYNASQAFVYTYSAFGGGLAEGLVSGNFLARCVRDAG
jgi:hypothetical protein